MFRNTVATFLVIVRTAALHGVVSQQADVRGRSRSEGRFVTLRPLHDPPDASPPGPGPGAVEGKMQAVAVSVER